MSREGVVDRVRIPVSHGSLEARIERDTEDVKASVIVGHPHPQHGGTMHSKPVYYLAKILRSLGMVTLRFQFRGVGDSTGEYDGGIGEMDDFRQAIEFIRQRYPSKPTVVGGFSFGSSIAIRVGWEDERVETIVGLGVPINLARKPYPAEGKKPILVIQGQNDEFGSPGDIDNWLSDHDHATVEILEGTDHFLTGALDRMSKTVMNYFTTGPGAEVLGLPAGGRGIP